MGQLRGNPARVEITHVNTLRGVFPLGVAENICRCVICPWGTELEAVFELRGEQQSLRLLPLACTPFAPLTASLGSLGVCPHQSQPASDPVNP